MTTAKRKSISVTRLSHGDLPIPIASRIGPFVATSGIAGLDRDSGKLPTSASQQVEHMFDNLRAVLDAAGCGIDGLIKLTIFLNAPDETRAVINDCWLRMFPEPGARPARHILNYALSHGMLVQCEALAVVSE